MTGEALSLLAHGCASVNVWNNLTSNIAPGKYRAGKKLLEVEAAISRLVAFHGDGILHENAVDLRFHNDPDGKYLIKGGGPKVWNRFRLTKEHRRVQGIIQGKRCGTTENLGPAVRKTSF